MTGRVFFDRYRYVIPPAGVLSGGGPGSGNNETFRWVRSTCTAGSSSQWSGSSATVSADRPGDIPVFGSAGSAGSGQDNRYDCSGYRQQTGA